MWTFLLTLGFLTISVRADCGFPGTPLDGAVQIDGREIDPADSPFVEGTKVVFQCRQNYRLSGSEHRICGPDGRWNGTVPDCLVNVARSALVLSENLRKEEPKGVAFLTNGLINTCGNWLARDSSLKFEFDDIQHLDGIRIVTRIENARNLKRAQWLLIGLDANRSHVERMLNRTNGEFRIIDHSLASRGEFTSLYWNISSTWNSVNLTLISDWDVPLCEIDIYAFQSECGHPEVPVNGRITWNVSESRVTYECDTEFQSSQLWPFRICINGRWEGDLPICQPKVNWRFTSENTWAIMSIFFGVTLLSLATAGCYTLTKYQLIKRIRRIDGRIPLVTEEVSFTDDRVSIA